MGGILFLDEISSMPTDIQAKLLRAIEERAFRRVAALPRSTWMYRFWLHSNRNVQDLIKDGKFREDLYYRLKGGGFTLAAFTGTKTGYP